MFHEHLYFIKSRTVSRSISLLVEFVSQSIRQSVCARVDRSINKMANINNLIQCVNVMDARMRLWTQKTEVLAEWLLLQGVSTIEVFYF